MKEFNSVYDSLTYIYKLGTLNSTYKFRGQSNFEWSLQPSIYRFENLNRSQTVFFEEALLGHKPKLNIPHVLNTGLDIEWLMLCQHYSIPTRLLDWTSDILVALFFACHENRDSDGAIFICDQSEYPSIPAIEYNPIEIQDLAFINTNVINPRMRAQSGCFMIWGHSPLNKDSSESYDLWQYQEKNNAKGYFIEKIIIPKENKSKILFELKKIYEITHTSLYIENGILEVNFKNSFATVKNNSLLCALYLTDSDRLKEEQREDAIKMLPRFGQNAFKGCDNLKSIKGIFRN